MNTEETRVQDETHQAGPSEIFRHLNTAKSGLIRSPDLDNGGLIVSAGTTIYTRLVTGWAGQGPKSLDKHRP